MRAAFLWLLLSVEDTGHVTIENHLTNLLFSLFSSFFCPFALYCFTSTVCSTPSKTFYSFLNLKTTCSFAIPILGICLLLFICRRNLFVTIIFVLHQYEIVIGLNGIQFKAVVREYFQNQTTSLRKANF